LTANERLIAHDLEAAVVVDGLAGDVGVEDHTVLLDRAAPRLERGARSTT
jgi:hypothetical protein